MNRSKAITDVYGDVLDCEIVIDNGKFLVESSIPNGCLVFEKDQAIELAKFILESYND